MSIPYVTLQTASESRMWPRLPARINRISFSVPRCALLQRLNRSKR
ncbi:uncharacterized protein HMPREF1541_03104 [Cyphellophora europaea CBS 101466]|uniref:Uncharacterized protein n=1 Tax=Cyphellophora europaea (strain CBS 101466) TaxID=1220924 RepID=W2RZP9_CYPE1|nr:uncharacterized protein HMPREF1541_03104 [Cyphellophora europaea CBS 101466]ETN41169.1 hypothetical protein HMPREF1541_03104 [Cyphellophora europaea CBS 101466]